LSAETSGARRRGPAARFGIAALNLAGPGLGLLRLGRPRLAAMLLLGPLAVQGLIALVWRLSPPLGFAGLIATGALLLLVLLGSLLAAVWLSWRGSAAPAPAPESRAPWTRWYGIVGVAILAILGTQLVADAARSSYRRFYIPSEAMHPTLLKDDHLIGWMRPRDAPRRGDVILLRMPGDAIYVKRVAALPGDVIAMRAGQVILNGRPVAQQAIGKEASPNSWIGPSVTRLRERFPGEAGSHEIYDGGESATDELAPTRVLPGHFFVLGDNRDNSADSRVARAEGGVEQLPSSDVAGLALYYLYGPSHRSGARIGPAR
jgi:signal peptidase I